MTYEVNIDNFSGPLDLLLHLVKQANIDILDIDIEQITKQYLEYIEHVKDLNIASEYLVMAAELIEIKSSYLLPKTDDENDDEFEEDPKEKLIKRLIEYEQYKNMTSEFKILEEYRHEVHTKSPSSLTEFKGENQIIDYGVSLEDLISAMNDFLKRQESMKPLNTKVSSKEYNLEKRSKEIRKILKEKKKINFTDLFDIVSREYIIITFLSILSMSKRQEIEIEQEDNFNNIVIKEKSGK